MPPPVVSNSTSSAGSSPAGSSITSPPSSSSSAGAGAPGSSLSAGTAGSSVGKRSSSSRDAKLDEIEQAIMDLIKQQDRFLICVEHAGEHNEMEELLSKVDPRFERTIFVRTKWQEYLKTLTTTEAVNKFLGLLPYEQGKCFLTSLTSTGHSHSRFSKAESYQRALADSIKEDLNLMESLQYNKRYQAMVGVHAFREYLVNLVWKQYQERFPEVLENINTRKREAQEAVMANRERQANLEPYKLRARASNYVVAFLQNLEKLLKGTLEGIPQQNGQTLDDELSLEESGPWMDQMARTIELEPDWNIPYTENKLYGKQQFERLLSQFRAVCHHCDMGMVTLDEVACAGGPTKVATISNFAWAASDIAQRKSMKALLPLIRQLHEKAIYIMKRSLDIVDYMLISQGKKSALPPASSFDERSGIPRRKVTVGQENPASAIYEYPYFIQTVKEHFFKFVDEVVADCVDKCKDEFYCTRIIYWDMMNFNGHKFPEKHYEMDIMEKKDEVVALSRVLFKDIRARIVQNVLLKFHNFFFMPIQNGLWGAVQGKVTSMTDVELAELFQAEPNKVTLQERDKELQGEMKQLASLEGEFLEASANFSRPK
ncbi:Dynamin like protein [Balamuthia mandrillaris]